MLQLQLLTTTTGLPFHLSLLYCIRRQKKHANYDDDDDAPVAWNGKNKVLLWEGEGCLFNLMMMMMMKFMK
jgi:hypothetical protein